MSSPDPLVARMEQHLPRLRATYGIARVRIYGSVARKEAREDSDVDLLVEFKAVPSLYEIATLQTELETLLGRRIDITTPGGLHPRVLAAAEREAIEVTG